MARWPRSSRPATARCPNDCSPRARPFATPISRRRSAPRCRSDRVRELIREQLVPRSREETFGFLSRAANLQAITPPWLRFEILTPQPIEMRAGTVIEYRLRLHGVPVRWTGSIED